MPRGKTTKAIDEVSTAPISALPQAMRRATPLVMCMAVYFCFAATRYMALKAVEIVFDSIHLLASNPFQAGALTLAALAVATYALDTEGKTARTASALYLCFVNSLDGLSLPSPSPFAPLSIPFLGSNTAYSTITSSRAASIAGSDVSTTTSDGISSRDVASWRIPNSALRDSAANGIRQRGRHRNRNASSKQEESGISSSERKRLACGGGGGGSAIAASVPNTPPRFSASGRRRAMSADVAGEISTPSSRRGATSQARFSADFDTSRTANNHNINTIESYNVPGRVHARALIRSHSDAAAQQGGGSSGVDGFRNSVRFGGSGNNNDNRRTGGGGGGGLLRMQRIASGQELAALGAASGGGGGNSDVAYYDGDYNRLNTNDISDSDSEESVQTRNNSTAWLLPTADQTRAWSAAAASALPSFASVVDSLRMWPSAGDATPRGGSSWSLPRWPSSSQQQQQRNSLDVDAAIAAVDYNNNRQGGCSTNASCFSPLVDFVDDRNNTTASTRSLQAALSQQLPVSRHDACRQYSRGGITARPSCRPVLETFAAAARLQARNYGGVAGTPATTTFSAPGHVAIEGCVRGAGMSALASIGLDGDCPAAIRNAVTDEMLLQLGALFGETASADALNQLKVPSAIESACALLGVQDQDAINSLRVRSKEENNTATATCCWEAVVEEHSPGLRVKSWRLPLRRGLYVYLTRAVLEDINPRDVRAFYLDDEARELWDDGALAIQRLPLLVKTSATATNITAESCMHRYVSKFPRPMAPREYKYARRVWHRPADGGCYVICRNCDFPSGVDTSGPADCHRAVEVLDYVSCSAIKALGTSDSGTSGTSTEVLTLYFEDSQVRPGLVKMAAPKGLWPFWQKYDAALRLFAAARQAAAAGHHHGRTRRASLDNDNDNNYHGAAASEMTAFAGGDDDLSEAESSDADEEAFALAALRACKANGGGGSVVGSSSKWAKRLIIAGAVRMVQIMMKTS